ncbi:MAG: N-acetylmuramoyl-L-alanine amidase, partial [Parcubacteria group bacterium]|nr:N-acetylmuramoyl-L-alanine amidase [Parcubacteria group bacterium]
DDGTAGAPVVATPTELPAGAQTYPNSDVPVILPRSAWESSDLQSLLTWLPGDEQNSLRPNDYQPVNRIFIHYTGTPQSSINTYSSVAIVQSIFRFHAVTREWGDIGYNYLIDQKGNVYEGRLGGNGNRGAHVYSFLDCINYNYGSIGISLIGDYSQTDMPEAMYTSLARLVGWLSAANSIDPANLQLNSQVWKNPKTGTRQCDYSTGSFISFLGPTVLGHKDVPGGNADPGKVNLERIRTPASTYTQKFDTLAYDADEDPSVYTLSDGVLKKAAENRSGYSGSVIRIRDTQKNLFPRDGVPTPPDGSIVQSLTRSERYLIENGRRRKISNEEFSNTYSNTTVLTLSDRELGALPLFIPPPQTQIPSASPTPSVAPYSDGTLVKGTGVEVYRIEKGVKRYITSATAFRLNGFDWNAITKADDAILSSVPYGQPILLPSGTLVRFGAPEVYRVDASALAHIPSVQIFKARNFQFSSVVTEPTAEKGWYATGLALGYPDGTLVRTQNDTKVYIVYDNKRHWIQTANIFKELGFSFGKILVANAQELAQHFIGSAIASTADYDTVQNGSSPASGPVPQPTPVPSPTGGPAPTPSPSPTTSEPTIRIGIKKIIPGSMVRVSADGEFDVINQNGRITTKQSGEIAEIPAPPAEFLRFVPKAPATIVTVLSYEDRLSWKPEVNNNRFRGLIEFTYSPKSQAVWMVNEIPIESYLVGMGEALNTDPAEYLKAFSIITRSYAMFHLLSGGKYSREVYHLNNTPSDQVYKGYTREESQPRIVEVTAATRGQVAAYQGKPIRAVYSSDSGGTTVSACTKWGAPFCDAWYDYLDGGVNDPEGTVHNPTRVAASHGVGMSAIGARKLAELGKSASDILQHYYRGVIIEKRY